jgi:type I pantothenate kinase
VASDVGLAAEVARGEPVAADEVLAVYLPLARWIEDRLTRRRRPAPGPGNGSPPVTAVVGITGSVAAGKTTTARVLSGLLRRGPGRPTVDLLATDGFLFPNRVLERRGLLGRKGFPETYDHRALVAALTAVRSGQAEVAVPVYSHARYDIVPGEVQWIRRPDLLVVEGLTVLQGPPGGGSVAGVDGPAEIGAERLVDLAVYVDADEDSLLQWHTERLLALRSGGAGDGAGPADFLGWLTSLSDAEVTQLAASSWSEINLVNLRDHVAPTRSRADVILEKDRDHRVRRVLVRRETDPIGTG